MSDRSKKRARGFSLIEMMIAMITGTVVLGGAVQLYSSGVSATFMVSQKAELQENFRAASNILRNDLSMAGAGLSNAAIALPATVTPSIGCDQSGTCYLGSLNAAAAKYPISGGVPYLYGLVPGWKGGPTLTSNPQATDTITVAYTDDNFLLNCYNAKITAVGVVTFALPVAPATWPTTCVFPPGITAPQAVNDTNVGLTAGDLVLFTTTAGVQVVAEVTTTPGGNVVAFAAGDVLHMNQAGVANSLLNIATNTAGTAQRILVITYYIDNTVNPPRLMRQIDGHTPMPVSDGMEFMQFSYDLYNGTLYTNRADGGASIPLTPNSITKINIVHLAMDSTMKGPKGFQGLDLETSVSARNLTFTNKYPCNPCS
jgi:prepilin-type N-terminal cleavage/methylation domain-containing protein